MIWLPTCFVVFFTAEIPLMTGYSSLDWYSSDPPILVRALVTATTLHVFEICIMFFSFYIHRVFPKEFSLTRELVLNLMAGWVTNTLVNVFNAFRSQRKIPRCEFDTIHGDFAIDLLRATLLIVIIYITTISSFTYFPLPYTWVFEDFSKFLFEPQCVRVFLNYLKVKEPSKLSIAHKLMKLYVTEFDRVSTNSKTRSNSNNSTRRFQSLANEQTYTMFQSTGKTESVDVASRLQFLDLLGQLEGSFRRYRRTKSFMALFTRLKNFEDITEHAAVSW